MKPPPSPDTDGPVVLASMRRAMWHRHGKTASRKQLQLMERQPGMRKRGDVEGRGRGEQVGVEWEGIMSHCVNSQCWPGASLEDLNAPECTAPLTYSTHPTISPSLLSQSHTLDALYPRASSDGRLAPLPETGVDADVGDALRPSTSLPRYMRPLQRGARPLTAPGIEVRGFEGVGLLCGDGYCMVRLLHSTMTDL